MSAIRNEENGRYQKGEMPQGDAVREDLRGSEGGVLK